MKTKAVRLYGKNDLRLEEFELPALKDDEILAKVVSDSICMSSYKATSQGTDHKRIPNDVADNPIIIGHELCGELVEVGSTWKGKFKEGERFSIQPALNYKPVLGGQGAPGYSYPYIGGDATYIILPREVMDLDCLLPYDGDAFYMGSLAEPVSCIIAAMDAHYHSELYVYDYEMGIKEGGKLAILAGAGPMGLAAIDWAVNGPRKPGLLVITDIDQARLDRAASIFSPEKAQEQGVELRYENTSNVSDPVEHLKKISGGSGYDDVMVFAPVPAVFEQGDRILGFDGCLNFFAGPPDPTLSATVNIYDIHYALHHFIGTVGADTHDMLLALEHMGKGNINPSAMLTHIGGLTAAAEATVNLPKIPGGKKLIYTHLDMELTAIDDFEEKGKSDPMFAKLAEITKRHNGLWSAEAEKYLLDSASTV
jgi:threonine dehydrogenase-like Zn-dependent dehydrogenase